MSLKKTFIFTILIIGIIFIVFRKENTTQPINIQEISITTQQDNPLTWMYHIDKTNSKPLTITVQGKSEDMNISYTFPKNFGTEFPILGLYPDYTNTVFVGSTTIFKIITASIELSNAQIITDSLPKPDPKNQDVFFICTEGQIIAYDRNGDIRFYKKINTHYQHTARVYMTNNQIVVGNDMGIMNLSGEFLTKFPDIDNHHDNIRMQDGTFLILSKSKWGVCDRIVQINDNKEIIRDLTFGSLFREIVTNQTEQIILNKIIYDNDNIYYQDGNPKAIDWAHANSLVYDNDTDILYLSLRNQALIAVDWSEWKLIWWMTDDTMNTLHDGVPNVGYNFLKIASLTPYRVMGDGKTNGPKNPHSLFLHKNGNIGMFDNQGDYQTNTNGSRYIEYKIIKHTNTWIAKAVREYRDSSIYSRITSDVDFVGNNHQNLLLGYGNAQVIKEINSDNEVLFKMQLHNDDFFYRVDKMPLYPYSNKKKTYPLEFNAKTKE